MVPINSGHFLSLIVLTKLFVIKKSVAISIYFVKSNKLKKKIIVNIKPECPEILVIDLAAQLLLI